jgi:hypothetical protein
MTVIQIFLVAAGNVAGDAFHPYGQTAQLQLASNVMLGQSVGKLFFNPINIQDILNQAQMCGILFGTATLFWLEAGFVLRGSRSKAIKTWQWGTLMVFTFLSVFQPAAILWSVRNYPDFANPMFFIMGTVQTLLYLAITLTIARIMRGRRRTEEQSPSWLLAV